METAQDDFVLGIDLGANSVGWAIVRRAKAKPASLVGAGARVFEAGMEGMLDAGREESRNKRRRDARLQRRQTWRRKRRLAKVFRLLQKWELLPSARCTTSEERQNFITQLDEAIIASEWYGIRRNDAKAPEQVMPYVLRSAALNERLEPHFLGRGLYHLAQRRGFLSNRKQVSSKEKADEEGVVKRDISELSGRIEESGARTLGEYFSALDPAESRIRQRWTARSMYENEFNQIWRVQSAHHPEILTEARKKELLRAFFFQRPLRIQRNLIGKCELEPNRYRAPIYALISQRFRMLDKVNNLKIIGPDGIGVPLSEEQRQKLTRELESEGDLKFSQIRKLLCLPKTCSLNLEAGGEERIPGNRTGAKFRNVIGERWNGLSAEDRERLVGYAYGFQKADKLKSAAVKKWDLDELAAEKLSQIDFESGYLNLSRAAIRKVLPKLEEGMSYAEARRLLYPDKFLAKPPADFLPPVCNAPDEVRSPAVIRSLTELRKVVNAVIRCYGKPTEIRIELARDLRNSRKQREAAWKQNRENQKLRGAAAATILHELGLASPSEWDKRKVLLAEECRWECPFTGKTISMAALIGNESQFDIEHIIPFSRSLDNSFANLTLCYHEENRNVKHNRTPYEAHGNDETRYKVILDRVKRFTSSLKWEKLRRFQMKDNDVKEFLTQFANRQLNDTRYASRLAGDYLSLLYGGRVDLSGKRRIRFTTGQVTAFLRAEWKLNQILNDGPTKSGGYIPKSRDDHRHHAVDAIVTALTDDGTIADLSRAAERASEAKRRLFAPIEAPWPNFSNSVRETLEKTVVSHRPLKRVSGPLHEESLYAAGQPCRIRKPLSALTKAEVEKIVDGEVKRLVKEKLAQTGEADPKKVFATEDGLPFFTTAGGTKIPIRRVRIEKRTPTFQLSAGRTARYVTSESNHHVEIFAELDQNGREVEWDAAVVSLAEAMRRKREGELIVRRDHGVNRQFKFSLAPGEVIEWDENKNRAFMVVRATTGGQIALTPVNDARQKEEMRKDGSYTRPVWDTLRKRNARKINVGPLGEVGEAYD